MRQLFLGWLFLVLLQACASDPASPELSSAALSQKSGIDSETFSAKDLFLDQGLASEKGLAIIDMESTKSKPKPKKSAGPVSTYQGLSYWIEKFDKAGRTQRVTASTRFHEGDRIRFHFRSNRSGYLYVVTQGSSGRTQYLFPTKASDNEFISARQNYIIPPKSAIVFDSQAGTETVWIFLSNHALPTGVAGTSSASVLASNTCGSKDLLIESPTALQDQCTPKTGAQSKDILIEDDKRSPEPAGYAVMSAEQLEKGMLLTLKLELHHQ